MCPTELILDTEAVSEGTESRKCTVPLERKRSRKRRYPRGHRKQLLAQYGAACVWCGCKLSVRSVTADHVRCVNDGGSDWLGNLLPACETCNGERFSVSAEEWLEECLLRGKQPRIETVRKAILRVAADPHAEHKIYVEFKKERAGKRTRYLTAKRVWEQTARAFWDTSFDYHAALVAAVAEDSGIRDTLGNVL